MSKRKIRDEDADGDSVVKAIYPSRSDEQVGRVGTSEQEQLERFSTPGLRFATESWAGMKTSNEDRHVSSAELFPGPVFGIFDGHGGTFSADFLSRHLSPQQYDKASEAKRSLICTAPETFRPKREFAKMPSLSK